MHIINRSIAILKAKQTYADWINALPGPASNMTLEKLAQDQTCYLIPSYDTVEQCMEFVLKNAKRILEAEFVGWDTSGEYWPKVLNRKTLREFFDVEISAEVFDMMRGPLEREEFF